MQLWKVSHSINFPYCFLKTSTDHIQRTLKTTGIRGSRSSPFMFTQTCLGQALDLAAEEFEPTAQSKASVISVQFSHSVMFDSLWPMDCSTPGFPVHHQLLGFTQTHVHRVGNVIPLILCRSLLFPPSIFPILRLFSNESVLRIRWPKYWNFSSSISPSSEYSGLISIGMDWLDFLFT